MSIASMLHVSGSGDESVIILASWASLESSQPARLGKPFPTARGLGNIDNLDPAKGNVAAAGSPEPPAGVLVSLCGE